MKVKSSTFPTLLRLCNAGSAKPKVVAALYSLLGFVLPSCCLREPCATRLLAHGRTATCLLGFKSLPFYTSPGRQGSLWKAHDLLCVISQPLFSLPRAPVETDANHGDCGGLLHCFHSGRAPGFSLKEPRKKSCEGLE